MIPYKVFPMFRLGPLHINMYGIMFALGFLAAIFLAVREAKKRNINKEIIYDLAFYLLIGGIVGARLFYIIFFWSDGTPLSLISAIAVWNGGLSWFGGFIGALVIGYVYLKKNKLNFWVYVDIFTVPLVIGHIFGRLGDYFIGGHPGKITNLPWAIYLQNALRHPVVLYELIGLGIIVVILLKLKKFKLFNGFLFLSYTMLYSIQRMILDFFRIESTDPKYIGLTPSQYIVIVLFIIAAYFLKFKYVKSSKKSQHKTKL